ncbi:PREDICTED: secretoglobin family 3A member 2 [Myotis davidii]|uniref:secretoglobin family 3A member 2 n=1 Tax=Myotis davidii TaxID=225400 RepID=UPI00076773BA|nr:PREDICTED: secretoglobin family 3A member 2 [Myotis davidii]
MTFMLFFAAANQVAVTEIQALACWTIGICSYSATAFLLSNVKDSLPLPPEVLPGLHPLKFLLESLGISVEHIVEGLRKCVNELGPEASESVKKLLGALTLLL